MIKKHLTMAFLIALCGCSHQSTSQPSPQKPPQLYWIKSQASQQDFATDKYGCLQTSISGSQSSSTVMPTMSSDFLQAANQNSLFTACMGAKGWSLQPAGISQQPIAAPQHQIASGEPAVASRTPEEEAYCLRLFEINLSEQKSVTTDISDPEVRKGRATMMSMTEAAIEKSKYRLRTAHLYSPEDDKPSLSLTKSTKQAELDHSVGLHDKETECFVSCGNSDKKIGNLSEVSRCVQACTNNYATAADIKMSACYQSFFSN